MIYQKGLRFADAGESFRFPVAESGRWSSMKGTRRRGAKWRKKIAAK